MTSPELARIHDLDTRIRDLEAKVLRVPGLSPGAEAAHTNCESKGCTNCRGDGLVNVLLPGEDVPLSGADLVAKLRTGRASH
jgi:hypothetical protein